MSTPASKAPSRLRQLATNARSALVRDADVLFFLILVPIATIVLVDPRGEFPLNDDWAYGLSVRHLAETGDVRLSHWGAMTLVWQAAYGGLVCAVTGFSFTALRFTTIVFALATNLLLYALFRRLSKNR